MSEKNIAVIIPAYKPDYLEATLHSLEKQTDKNFKVYIGDDNSPSCLKTIINPFEEKINISYRRFETNFGKDNLVGHWDRCLSMLENEDFFIMFSDDDLMEENCIRDLRNAIQTYNEDVFHFNLQIIDKEGRSMGERKDFPDHISALDFFDQLCSSNIDARMPEFVFRTKHFTNSGGFVPFKDAIRSDNATVIACALAKGIRTVQGPSVLWRDSGINVSSSFGPKSKDRYETFLVTTVMFFNWMEDLCKKNNVELPWSILRRFDYLFSAAYNFRPFIGTKRAHQLLKKFKHYPTGWKGVGLWTDFIKLKIRRKLGLIGQK